ncbi:MAG: hypothetical protein NTV88_01800 [Candidatus Micrarchaeota archaeon]|nr:hypothetical protein [Candidatus Micrarchaeota archaeon]
MVDAMAAFGEAFAAYKKSISDFIVYSILMEISGLFLAGILLLLVLASGAIFLGGFANVSPASLLSLGGIGLIFALAVVGIGALLFAWLAGGLNGAYIDTLNSLLSGRKQSLGGFFGAITKKATPLLLLSILTSIIILVPAALIIFLFSLIGGPGIMVSGLGQIGLIGIAAAFLYALAISFFMILAVPAVIIDNKGPLAAVGHSFSTVAKNIVAVIIYVVLTCIAALPMIIPGVNLLYAPLFYMPVTQSALVILYKKAK